jgi:hypothetical protein
MGIICNACAIFSSLLLIAFGGVLIFTGKVEKDPVLYVYLISITNNDDSTFLPAVIFASVGAVALSFSFDTTNFLCCFR